jgi:hypothetical protein
MYSSAALRFLALSCFLALCFSFRFHTVRLTTASTTSTSLSASSIDPLPQLKLSTRRLLSAALLTVSLVTANPIISSNINNNNNYISFSSVANADDNTGTKNDKKFELCVSKCVFEETRPPPVGSSNERLEATSTRQRPEIIKACRKTCAKNKQQLMIGDPKKVRTPQQQALAAPLEQTLAAPLEP